MKIRAKIALIAILPTLAFLLMGLRQISQAAREQRIAKGMQQSMDRFRATSVLIHELQKERGLSALFIGGGTSWESVETQQGKSRAAAESIQANLNHWPDKAGKLTRSTIESLERLRSDIRTIRNADPIRTEYTKAIRQLLEVETILADIPTTQGIGKVFSALGLLETAKENTGRMRALCSNILAVDAPLTPDQRAQLFTFKADADGNLGSPALSLSDEGKESLRSLKEQEAWKSVDQTVARILERGGTGKYGQDSKAFFATITHKVDDLAALIQAEETKAGSRTRLVLSQAQKDVGFTVIVDLLAVISIGAISLRISRDITRSMTRTTLLLEDIATGEGDLTRRLEVASGDEVGEMATHFNRFMDKLQTMVQQVQNLTQNLSSASTELSAVSSQMATNAQSSSERSGMVASAAEEMSVATASMASDMGRASLSIEHVADSMQQMTSTISEIASTSDQTRLISEEATRQSQQVSELMTKLGTSAQAIGKVTETISRISAQTNLLALNATIEASRAGSAGKGFAVVASEIKELAQQTANATEDIKARVMSIQSTTSQAVHDIQRIGTVIAQSSDAVRTIAAAIEEQSVVTKSIATHLAKASSDIQRANLQTAQGSEVTQSIAADITRVNQATEEIASGSAQVKISALELSKLAEQLQQLMGRFQA